MVKSAAPTPLANYTEAFTLGNLIFAAGQIASDYKTGLPAQARKDPAFPFYGSDIKKQTHYILADFNAFDEVWKEYFKVPPARTTIGTSGLLVAGTLVEIDLIGHIPGKGSKREAITSGNPKPLANYTEAFRAGDLVFAAGQIASDFSTGVAREASVDPAFPFYGSDQKADPLHPQQPEEHLRSRRELA